MMLFGYTAQNVHGRFFLKLLILWVTSNSGNSRLSCQAFTFCGQPKVSNSNLSRQRIEPSTSQLLQPYLAAEDLEEEYEPPTILTTHSNERMSKEDEEEIDAIFNCVDVDGSGCIDCDELNKYLAGQGFSTKAIQKLFSKMDTDQNGKISRKEFRHIFQYYDSDIIFDIVDRDGSGYIDRNELQNHLSSSTAGYSKQEIEKLFSRMDTDQNGQISREEFHQAMQLTSAPITGDTTTGTDKSNKKIEEDCPRGYFLDSVKSTFQPLGPLGRMSQRVETMGPFKHVHDKITNLFGVDKKQISKLGVSFMLSYSILSHINGALSLTMAWYISCKQTGLSPLLPGQWKSLLKSYGMIYGLIQLFKPFRVAAAIGMSKLSAEYLEMTQDRLRCSKTFAIAIQYTSGWIITGACAMLGISIVSFWTGVPLQR